MPARLPWREPWQLPKAPDRPLPGSRARLARWRWQSPLAPPPCWRDPPELVVLSRACRAATVPSGSPSRPCHWWRRRDLLGLAWATSRRLGWSPADHGPGFFFSPAMPTLVAGRYRPVAASFDLSGRRLWLEGEEAPPAGESGRSWWPGSSPEQVPRRPAWSAVDPGRWHWHTGEACLCRPGEQLARKDRAGDLFQPISRRCCEGLLEQPPRSAGALFNSCATLSPAPFSRGC